MAKKIRLIDDPETESIETTDDGEGLSSAEKQKLMKTIEAMDWKLWELYQTAQRVEKYLGIDEEKEDEK